MKSVLVTGGAGYIGSHVVRQLVERGERVVVLDNLSSGFRSAVLGCAAGRSATRATPSGSTQVLAEYVSIRSCTSQRTRSFPSRWPIRSSTTGNNTCATRNLLECCQRAGVRRFVFSSTAAVYGIPARTVSPRGHGDAAHQSLWHVEADERMDAARSCRVRRHCATWCCGISTSPAATRSVASVTRRPRRRCSSRSPASRPSGSGRSVAIFGTDYPTPDGTGVRDYIHVEDLADAHLRALDYLAAGGDSTTLNCGYGHGYSVREVLATVQRVHGAPLVRQRGAATGGRSAVTRRRMPARVRDVLGWSPRFDDLEVIVRTQLEWEHRLLREPGLQRN